MRPALAALLALVLALAGCTTAANDTADLNDAEQEVADVVDDLEQAAADDDPQEACEELFAPALRQKLGANCARTIQAAFDDADSLQLNVDSVRITGTTARMRVTSGSDDDQTDLIQFAKEGSNWKITGVEPVKTKSKD